MCVMYAIYVMYTMRFIYYIYVISLVLAESESYEGNDIYEDGQVSCKGLQAYTNAVYICAGHSIYDGYKKRQKIVDGRSNSIPPCLEKNRFSFFAIARKLAIVPKHSNYLNKFCNFEKPFKKLSYEAEIEY